MKTYTKKMVKIILPVACVGGMMPFILSMFGRDPVSEIGVAWIGSVAVTIIGYLMKSYLETKAEKKQELDNFLAGMDIDEEG